MATLLFKKAIVNVMRAKMSNASRRDSVLYSRAIDTISLCSRIHIHTYITKCREEMTNDPFSIFRWVCLKITIYR